MGAPSIRILVNTGSYRGTLILVNHHSGNAQDIQGPGLRVSMEGQELGARNGNWEDVRVSFLGAR